jgi:hypothetical protein
MTTLRAKLKTVTENRDRREIQEMIDGIRNDSAEYNIASSTNHSKMIFGAFRAIKRYSEKYDRNADDLYKELKYTIQ